MVLRGSAEQQHHHPRIMNNLHRTLATVVTETVAAVMAPSMENNHNNLQHNRIVATDIATPALNTSASGISNNSSSNISSSSGGLSHNIDSSQYDFSSAGLMYWSGDGGGRLSPGSGSIVADSALGMSLEGSGDVIGTSASNSFDLFNASYFSHGLNDTDMFCQDRDPFTNMTYMNLTCDAPVDYVVPLYGYCMPFLLIVTVLSNSLIVLILSKKNMSTPTNFVLMGKLMKNE